MRVKYNRTSTTQQQGERFKLDTDQYGLTLFDKGFSGKVPFAEREKGGQLIKLIISVSISRKWSSFRFNTYF